MVWGSGGIRVGWEVYEEYGEKRLVGEEYEGMWGYVDYVGRRNMNGERGILEEEKVWGKLGEWVGGEDKKNEKRLMWEG